MTDIAHCSLSITSITLWPSECNSLVTTLLIVIENVTGALLVSLVSNPAGIVSDISVIAWTMRSIHPWLTREITWTPGRHSPRVIIQGMHSVSQCDQYIKNISSPHKSNAMETWTSSHCWPCSCFTIAGDNKPRLFWHHGYCHLKNKPSSVEISRSVHQSRVASAKQ